MAARSACAAKYSYRWTKKIIVHAQVYILSYLIVFVLMASLPAPLVIRGIYTGRLKQTSVQVVCVKRPTEVIIWP